MKTFINSKMDLREKLKIKIKRHITTFEKMHFLINIMFNKDHESVLK